MRFNKRVTREVLERGITSILGKDLGQGVRILGVTDTLEGKSKVFTLFVCCDPTVDRAPLKQLPALESQLRPALSSQTLEALDQCVVWVMGVPTPKLQSEVSPIFGG